MKTLFTVLVVFGLYFDVAVADITKPKFEAIQSNLVTAPVRSEWKLNLKSSKTNGLSTNQVAYRVESVQTLHGYDFVLSRPADPIKGEGYPVIVEFLETAPILDSILRFGLVNRNTDSFFPAQKEIEGYIIIFDVSTAEDRKAKRVIRGFEYLKVGGIRTTSQIQIIKSPGWLIRHRILMPTSPDLTGISDE